MQSEMKIEEARAYVERWQLVRKRQREEARRLPLEERLRRLALLMRTRRGLPASDRSRDDEAIRTVVREFSELLEMPEVLTDPEAAIRRAE